MWHILLYNVEVVRNSCSGLKAAGGADSHWKAHKITYFPEMWLTVILKVWGGGRKRGGLKAPIGMCTFFPSSFSSFYVSFCLLHAGTHRGLKPASPLVAFICGIQ